ncbi:MAG: capsid assembly scaffolding protein Gp46 family protein [Motilibacteraceae bacterium]
MTEPTSTQPPADPATTAPAPVTDPNPQGDPADLGEGGKKALEAERKRAAQAEREAKALKARLDEIEAANLSELEKAQKAAADAAARLAEYEKTTLRQRVALAKGVPADLVDRLRGDTEDEISADADALMALVKAPTTPLADPSQGARGGATPLNSDGLEQALRSKLGIPG